MRGPSTSALLLPKAWDIFLTQVSERLNSKGGEPVIQLQIRPTPRRLRAFPCEDPNPQGIRST
jgi:hypothetical protein